MLSFQNEAPSLTFQEQAAADLDAVFFNAAAKESVTTHKIKVSQKSPEHECQVIVDSERYLERMIKDKIENVNLNGLVFFIKESDWRDRFTNIPIVNSELFFDGKRYKVVAVGDDTGMLEFTIEAWRGN